MGLETDLPEKEWCPKGLEMFLHRKEKEVPVDRLRDPLCYNRQDLKTQKIALHFWLYLY